MQKIAIIIPCYNEELRLRVNALSEIVAHTNADLYIANDGSTDNTFSVIESFAAANPARCKVLDFKENQGKANTIFRSMHEILQMGTYDFIGYFDADFATPPQEIMRMLEMLEDSQATFIFGSRVLLMNYDIKRKWYRHIIGRIIVTLINYKFNLGIYDTQCGAKIFSKDLAVKAFEKPFHTSWLFDVEVFIRLKKQDLLVGGNELPLREWRDVEGSKLSWKHGVKILGELNQLFKHY